MRGHAGFFCDVETDTLLSHTHLSCTSSAHNFCRALSTTSPPCFGMWRTLSPLWLPARSQAQCLERLRLLPLSLETGLSSFTMLLVHLRAVFLAIISPSLAFACSRVSFAFPRALSRGVVVWLLLLALRLVSSLIRSGGLGSWLGSDRLSASLCVMCSLAFFRAGCWLCGSWSWS